MLRSFLFLISSFILISVKAQQIAEEEKTRILEQRIELIAEENEDEQLDYSHLTDLLDFYFDNPLNLNLASREELEELSLLSRGQIDALENHIENFGPLLNVYELQVIDEFDTYDYENLRPFIAVSKDLDRSAISLQSVKDLGKHEIFILSSRIVERQRGYQLQEGSEGEGTPYLGDPNRIYSRYRFRYKNNISIGLTGEKDPGEELFQGSQKTFDFSSGHLFWSYPGKINKIAIGDFQAQFGQGLTIWSGLAFGKSIDLTSLKRNPRGISAYASADENRFLRGFSVGGEFNSFSWTVFGSSKRIDANLVLGDTLNGEEPGLVFSSIQNSGFHRTENELFDKDAIRERHLGASLAFQKRNLEIGVLALHTEYEGEFQRNLQVYNQFDFNANQNLATGLHYDWTIRNFNLYGETTRSENGAFGTINGLLAALDPKLSLSALYRNFARDFQSILSNPTMESSRAINEKGLLLGLDYHPSREWNLSVYFDRFEFPWLRFLSDAPSQGQDAFVQLQWRPSRAFKTYLRYRKRIKAENVNDPLAIIDYPSDAERVNVRWHAEYKISPSVMLKNRIEWIQRDEEFQEREIGFLIYQDLNFQPLQSPWTIKLRYALFDTPSYDARLYAYESDLIYTFSIPAFSGTGTRWYAMCRYKFSRKIEFWIRLSQFAYQDQDTVLSGFNEISGNTRTDLRLMVRARF
ncbi:MAG: hypothetical protein AAF487_04400 [Bacteroidota bacterium]